MIRKMALFRYQKFNRLGIFRMTQNQLSLLFPMLQSELMKHKMKVSDLTWSWLKIRIFKFFSTNSCQIQLNFWLVFCSTWNLRRDLKRAFKTEHNYHEENRRSITLSVQSILKSDEKFKELTGIGFSLFIEKYTQAW